MLCKEDFQPWLWWFVLQDCTSVQEHEEGIQPLLWCAAVTYCSIWASKLAGGLLLVVHNLNAASATADTLLKRLQAQVGLGEGELLDVMQGTSCHT